jgi:hypothetical protein
VRCREKNTSTEEEEKKTQACHFHSQNQGKENLDLEEWGVLGVEILVLKTPPPLFFVKSESILPLSFPPQKHSYLKHQV